MLKSLIFDFDGTLADTLDLALQYGNSNHERLGCRPITREEFRDRSMKEVLSFIQLPLYQVPTLLMEMKRTLREHLHLVSLFPGMGDTLRELKESGYDLYIMSSNSLENIEGVLEREGVLKLFKTVYSDSSLFGKHIVLKRLLASCGIDQDHAIYIGDEVRDAEACQKIGIKMIAVSWGWDSRKRLERVGGLRVAHDLTDFMSLMSK